MGWACSMYEGQKRRTQNFGGGNWRERDHLEEPEGRIILRWVFRSGMWGHGLD